jgi:hypothetical protein
MEKTPKIFISYSWSSPSHEEWVINLAERLVSDGIDVVFDKWDLKEGHDKYDFMESTVKSDEIDKVIIISDKKYTDKANTRSDGVGTEAQIISPKIYENVTQEKFIPLVREQDENGKAYLPTFLNGRIYIDFSSDEHFELNYESLLRNIYQRPTYNKPKLGKAPGYLFDETPMNHKTTSILRSFENQIEKNPKRINSIIREFLDEFYTNLKDYPVTCTSNLKVEVGKVVCENINQYTPLRNDFISFFNKISKTDLEFDIDILIRFLEKLPLFKSELDGKRLSNQYFDNYKFIIHELFIYLVAIALKNENYKMLEELFYSSYFFQDISDYNREPNNFSKLYNYIDVIDMYYKEIYSSNFICPMADFIIKRVPEGFTIDMVVEADLICHYICSLNNKRWFPITYIYKQSSYFDFLQRFVSKRHFEKAKGVFEVNTSLELQEKLRLYKESDKSPENMRHNNAVFEYVKPIYTIIDIDKIASSR